MINKGVQKKFKKYKVCKIYAQLTKNGFSGRK